MRQRTLAVLALTALLFVALGPAVEALAPQSERVSFSADRVVDDETVVYITKTGKKYHRGSCRYLKQSKIKTTLKKAKRAGYGACKVCKPPT